MKQPPANFRKKHRWSRRGLLAGVLLLPLVLADRGFALDPARSLQQYNCQTWSRQNGLPANGITAITQTKDGYLWFGTAAGLLRFDGTEFKVLDLHSVAALRTSYVTSLASARSGGLWVGLEQSAFGFYDGQTFSFRGAKVVALDVQSLLESRNGTLWLAAKQQAARLNPSGELETILPSAAFTNTTANAKCVYEDRQGRVWFGTLTQGAFYWQDGKITKLAAPELEGTPVLCITEDLAGQIWIGSQNGLYCYDASLKRREIPPLQSAVSVLLVDRHGVLWIGTSWIGLARYENGRYDFFLKTDGLDNDSVQALGEDSEGNLWIGTGGGLDQLSDVKFPIQPANDDPKITDANSVTAARNGGVWIASYGGVRWFDPRTRTYTNGPGLPDTFTKRVFEARNGDLYFVCGTTNLVVSSGGKIVATYGAPDLVVAMTEDDQGVVVSVAANLYRAGTNYFRPYTFKTNVPPEFYWISNLASGRDGVIWVACGNGIFRIKDGVWQHWSGPEGLVDANVQTVTEDQDGVLWAGLFSDIARLKDNQIRLISRKDGLFDNNIYAIVPDDLGNLWVDSARGIYRVARSDMNAFTDGKTNRVACTVFDGLDSVKTTDKTAQERVGCKTADGRIWFPGPLGVVMIDPAHVPVNPVAPPVHIERVLADGREVARNASIVVPPGKGELEFDYNAVTFIAPQKVQFRYRLEGYDKDWVDAGNRRMAFYTNLKPGRYTFSVIAANADGVWNETGDAFHIELRPHYYQTGWFRLLCGGLAFAALMGVYLQRVRRLTLKQQALQKNRDLLESEVQKRTSELRNEIAERRQAEAALVETSALLETLLQNTTDKIYFKDLQSRFVRFSQQCLEVLHLTQPAELKGKTDFDFFSEEHARPAFEAEQEIIRTGKPIFNLEEKETHRDGRVSWALTSKMAWRDQAGNVIGTMGISRDITARKRMEDQLFQSQKMETVGKLAGGVAHEFNSILTAIICQSELLLEDLPAGSPLAENATEIRSAAERAAVLTRQLLAYGRKQFLQPEILDLNAVLAGLASALRHLLGPGADVRLAPAAGLKAVKVDAGQLEQVIMNLAMNAADAMPNGGQFTLETANVTLDQEYVSRFPELKAGEYVMLAITDTGMGMSEEVKARVFEPFFTTKDVGQGTGLGLSTCYGILKQSGGHISVYSELARGATFKIYLPQVEPLAKIPLQRLASPDLPRGTETILLVEDDPALREMAATLLERLGYTVLAAANGVEALRLKQQRGSGHIDLLFTDVVMPHMSGKELADRVRALSPHTRILFTSGYTENTIVQQGGLNPGAAFLQKPFTLSLLARKVREALDEPGVPQPATAQ